MKNIIKKSLLALIIILLSAFGYSKVENSDIFGSNQIIDNQRVYTMVLSAAQSSPTDSTMYFFGSNYAAAPTTSTTTDNGTGILTDDLSGYYRYYVPKTGVIRSITLTMINGGTFATTEDATMYLVINNSSIYTITSSLKYNANGGVYTLSNQNIPISAGDYVGIKLVTPAWVTNPTNTTHNIILTVQY